MAQRHMRSVGKLSFSGLALALLISAPIAPGYADDVQYAQPAPGAPANAGPALSDIMNAIQARHAKLWYAGNLGNWPLAKFELTQVRDEFIRAATLYGNIPIDAVQLVTDPLNDMDKAVSAQNSLGFVAAYKAFTNGCNACHAAGDVGFIAIRVPTAQPYSNQVFAPAPKAGRTPK